MTGLVLERDPNLVLARLHLRLGSLGLARAELEGMAGQLTLDEEGLVDLAEVRWRTGDLTGAGEAAQAALAAGSEAIVAYVIAAEATAAVGRPAEARRLASRALELADLSVSDVFAGMPRASIWPVDPAVAPIATTLFDAPRAVPGPVAPDAFAAATPTPGLWDDGGAGIDLPDPALALDAGRAALEAGDPLAGALHLSLALRLAPSLAPAVLDALAPYDGPEVALVKGDAYRLVGHERDARLAFATAAAGIRAPVGATSPSHKERS